MPDLLKPATGTGLVIVKLDNSFSGAGAGAHLFVDGHEVADLYKSEKVELYLEPGDHVLSMKSWESSTPFTEVSVRVVVGDNHVFRLKHDFGEPAVLIPTAF